MNLTGKTALVTGAGRGIGRGCALELARCGAQALVLNDRPGSHELAATAAELKALGAQVHTVEADVFAAADRQRLVAMAVAAAGELDILVSNPACGVRRAFLEYDLADFERVIAATLTSGFHLGQLVARRMVARGRGGKIVYISSVQAEMPLAGSVAYNAAKAGLNHLARSIAVELSPHGIQVNVIEPGWTDTPGEHAVFGAELIRREGVKLPLGRLGSVADIGRAAAFLCSADADYITGAVLAVDGGFRYKDCRAESVPTELVH